MDLDIIRKIKFPHLKASFQTLALKHKLVLILFLVSILNMILPHEVYAQIQTSAEQDSGPVLVFDTGNSDYQDYLDQISADLTDQYYQDTIRQQAIREQKLIQKVQEYLAQRGSPLAPYTSTIVTLRNWKKILALSNAESSLCLHYPPSTSNCWGVGGANLWDMGSNLGDGVISMNHFLNNYPRRSPVKYAQMSFEKMNGLYKQPPAQHWVDNNYAVYDDLTAIENSL